MDADEYDQKKHVCNGIQRHEDGVCADAGDCIVCRSGALECLVVVVCVLGCGWSMGASFRGLTGWLFGWPIRWLIR